MGVPPRYSRFWQAFCQTRAVDPTPRFLEAFHFDDNEPSANELAALVVQGRKRATAALVWAHERENKPVPRQGDLSIVTDFAGDAVCIIETTRVDIVPFDAVSAEFAATEGEADGSLEYWRRAHEMFFGRECRRIGRQPEHDMPVVCERFAVVFKRADSSDAADTVMSQHGPGRRIDAFFYGLFMDESILRQSGVAPVNPRRAWVSDFALRIGRRATLVPFTGSKAFGMLVALTHTELDSLYNAPGLEHYRPEAVVARTLEGCPVPALCYNLREAPDPGEGCAEYAERLRGVLSALGFPREYIESIR